MRRHSTATLMGLTKKELVEYVRMAEHNQEVAEETLNQQAENVKDWMPVVHGRWIFKHNPITDPKGYFIRIVCSECNLHTGQKSNYCPQCGAKMDGERRTDE